MVLLPALLRRANETIIHCSPLTRKMTRVRRLAVTSDEASLIHSTRAACVNEGSLNLGIHTTFLVDHRNPAVFS